MEKTLKTQVGKSIEFMETVFLALAMFGVAGIMLAAAICRYTSFKFMAYEEIVLIVAFWMYMVGATRGTRTKTMIVADVINVLCKSEKIKDVISLIEKLLTCGLNVLFFSWSVRYIIFSISIHQVTAILRMPVYVVHLSVVVGLGLMMIYNAVFLFDRIITLKKKYFSTTLQDEKGVGC